MSGWVARLLAASLLFTLVASVSPALVSGASPLPAPIPTSSHSRTGAKLVPAVTPLEGIDVSRWQATINWPQVKAAGKQFVVMKATEGTGYVDPMYATNRAGAMGVGIPMAAYHFASPDSSPNEAVQEADHYVAVAGLTAGNLLPALDLEQTGGLAPAALQVWVRAWLDEVTAKLGIRPMIYVSPSFWSSKVGNNTSIALAGYKTLWIANWGVTSPTVPANNWSGNGYTFWQYTDCGHVAGITTGCVDLDQFNGSSLTAVTYNPTFAVSASPISQSVMRGGSTTFAITVTRNEFVPPVTLSLTSALPAGTTASFSPNPVTGSTSTLTITTSNVPTVTPPGIVAPTITGVGGGLTKTTLANLTVLPALPDPPTAPVATPLDAAAFVTWTPPANDGGGSISSYTVTAAPGGRTCTASGAVSCIVTGLANGTAYAFSVTARNSSGSGAASAASPQVTPVQSIPGATYFGITASRLVSPTTIKTKVAKTVQVTGVDGIPSGAIAVTGNLTVVRPASNGYLSVTSVATNAPTTSTLNFPAHDTRANAVTMPLGPGGKLSFTYVGKTGSSAQIIFDVTGYFLPGASGASYFGLTPTRIVNPTAIKTRVARTIQVTGVAGIPDGAVAVTGNLTVVNPAAAGYLSVTSVATSSPATSTLNFPAHDTRANAVTAPLGAGGKLSFTYVGGTGSTASIIFDVTGYFLPGASGASYFGVIPNRLVNPTMIKTKLAKTVQVTTVNPNPAMAIPDGAVAVTGNLTVVDPAAAGYLSVTSVATNAPKTSTLNFPAHDTRANAVTTALGSGGKLGFTYVGATGSSTEIIFDLTGYFLASGS
ncbi:MAG TPA: GH25 family lysozyme [Candidatus Limnocylindrales bacterium]|nr:GH25 family lysozyme [Candidatus Limnocylindrales bacterium]